MVPIKYAARVEAEMCIKCNNHLEKFGRYLEE